MPFMKSNEFWIFFLTFSQMCILVFSHCKGNNYVTAQYNRTVTFRHAGQKPLRFVPDFGGQVLCVHAFMAQNNQFV